MPTILGFDPLFQFMHEHDVVRVASCIALDKRPRGVFNVAGPQPVPLSMRHPRDGAHDRAAAGVRCFTLALGRFGLPKLPPGALEHIKYPVIVDGSAFKKATGFVHQYDEKGAMKAYRDAFPRPLS